MTGVEKETVAGNPGGVVGVGDEELRVEHVDEVGASHGTSRVA